MTSVRGRALVLLLGLAAMAGCGRKGGGEATAGVRLEALTPTVISQENQNPGSADWQLAQPTTVHQLEGYAGATSVNHGGSVAIHLNSDGTHTATWMLFRMGYYQGLGARLVAQSTSPVTVYKRNIPVPVASTGLIECRWPVSFTIATSSTWVSGVYLVRAIRDDGYDTWIPFVVRADERKGVAVFQSSVNTWEAYNAWGGESLYADDDGLGLAGGHGYAVSFNRPYDQWGSGEYFWFENLMVQWIESRGYDVTYITDVDMDRDPTVAQSQKLFMDVGHDEYWSAGQRAALNGAIASGEDVAFFSANSIYWQIRYQAGYDGTARRTIVCYKDDSNNVDPRAGTPQQTVMWREPPVNEPENAVLGVMYQAWELSDAPWVVQNSSHWLYAGTGAQDGDTIPLMVGYEVDRTWDNGEAPSPQVVLAESPVMDHTGMPSMHEASMYTAAAGGWVFAAGTHEWSYGLSLPGVADVRVQTMTDNLLIAAGLAPGSVGSTFGAGTWPTADLSRAAASVTTLTPTGSGATLNRPIGAAYDSQGNLFVSDTGNDRVVMISPSGVATVIAGVGSPGTSDGPGLQAGMEWPEGVAVASDGSLYVSDTGNNRIVHIARDASWTLTTFAGNPNGAAGFADGQGTQALFFLPVGLALVGSTLYAIDSGNNRLCSIAPDGTVTTVVGFMGAGYADGPGSQAEFYRPTGLASGDGSLWVVDTGARTIRQVSLDGTYTVSTVGGIASMGAFADGPSGSSQFMPWGGIAEANGMLWVADTGNERVRLLTGGSAFTLAGTGRMGAQDGAGSQATFNAPTGVVPTPNGGLLVIDEGSSALRIIGSQVQVAPDGGSSAASSGSSTGSSTGSAGTSGSTGTSGTTGSTGSTGQQPVAVITGGPYSGAAPLAVYLDATTSYTRDSSGWIQAFHWDFGDGSTSDVGYQTHTFQANGTYTVVLTAIDGDGVTATATQQVVVGSGTALSSGTTAGSSSRSSGSTGGTGSSGSTGTTGTTGGSPDAGAPAIQLKVTANPGLSGSAPFWVELDASGSTCTDPNDWITAFTWQTSDGATSSDSWIDHTFSASGTYSVLVTATDAEGNQAQQAISIPVE